jgi:hypothetical protein
MMDDAEQPTALPPISVFQLRELRDRPALTNAEVVEALVKFANDGSYAARVRLQLGVNLGELAQHGDRPLLKGMQPAGQQELRDALNKIVKGKVPASLAALWRRRADGLLFLRVFVPGGEHRYRWEEFESWKSEPQPVIANALLLLLEKPFRGKLCRCGLAECGRFFFADRPPEPDRHGNARGAPVRNYCPGTDHRVRARKIAARERMAKLRADRAKQGAARKHK